ncbi:MAG TPA: tripartite tricarboxylate transporter substrate binding protein [Beijerinckiaceae bacterium]|jgi:tripartite-type tricarboxylate transporter receptor subunit TctC
MRLTLRRRDVLLGAILCGAGARAQSQPGFAKKPIQILVGFAAGGAPDALARLVAEQLGPRLGTNVIVENRVGAQGNLAMAAVAKAEPDGHTLALVPVGNAAINPSLLPTLPYDVARDFAPVTLLANVENVLVVGAASPARSLSELVALGQRAPGGLSYATPGAGSLAHLGAELLARGTGLSLRHVPYRGVAPALTDVVRGEVDLMIAQLSTAKPFIEGGQLRALGVASRERSPALPDVPTIAEAAGLADFEAVSWYALMAPAGTPPAILEILQRETASAIRAPGLRAGLEAQGARPVGSTAAELAAVIASDTERWRRVIAEAKIRIE